MNIFKKTFSQLVIPIKNHKLLSFKARFDLVLLSIVMMLGMQSIHAGHIDNESVDQDSHDEISGEILPNSYPAWCNKLVNIPHEEIQNCYSYDNSYCNLHNDFFELALSACSSSEFDFGGGERWGDANLDDNPNVTFDNPATEELTEAFTNVDKEDKKWQTVENAIDPLHVVKYVITVQTGDTKNSGTNAGVDISADAANGRLGWIRLDDPNRNDHERYSLDAHHVGSWGGDKGGINSITIRHNNGGNKPGWKLISVEIKKYAGGCNPCTYMFTNTANGGWLATTYGDGKIERTIY